jgi:HK97 family phage major capsid protein
MMGNAVLQRLVDERGQIHENIDQILHRAEEEERDPSDAERELIRSLKTRLGELEPQIGEIADFEETRSSARDAQKLLGRPTSGTPAPATAAAAAGEQPVYRSFGQFAQDQILARYPMIASRAGPGARERAEERLTRAVANTITTDIPGLLPVQHLAQIIDVINRARPVVQVSRSIALTAGQVTYPKITQRPIIGEQTAEKTELPSQKMTVALNTVPAKVYGGSGDLSWQSVVWSNPDAMQLWFDLMAEQWAKQTESVACAEVAAQGAPAITVATDDLAGWMAAIAEAAGAIYTASGRRPDTLATDVATGYGLLGMVAADAPVFIAAGSGNLQAGTGTVAGLRLVISGGFAAKAAVVFDSSALLTAENSGAPVELRAVEPSIAGFEVGVVGAFLAEAMDPAGFKQLAAPAGP